MINGDTVHGLIKYRGWDKNPRSISFLAHSLTAAIEYGPSGILAFFVADEYYESAIVDVDISPTDLKDLSNESQPQYVKDTVFLQSVFRGERKLFYLKDRRANEHFFIDDGGYKPLVYKKYRLVKEIAGKPADLIHENQQYKGQLQVYLSGCEDIAKKIQSTRYQIGALTNLFSFYHACLAKPVKYVRSWKALDTRIGVLAGVTGTNLQFSGDPFAFAYLIEPTYTRSVTPSIGIFADATLVRSPQYKIKNDLFYSSFNISGEGTTEGGSEVKSDFIFQYLKLHNMLQLNILRNGMLHAAAGISSAVLIKEKSNIDLIYFSGVPSERKFYSRDYEFGYVAEIGSDFGRITIDLRYEKTTGISRALNLSSRVTRLHLLARYRLRR